MSGDLTRPVTEPMTNSAAPAITVPHGGPAFPILNHKIGWHGDIQEMHAGMTLRDWFAGQALASVAQHYRPDQGKACAKHALRFADALLEARMAASTFPEDAA